MKRNNNLKFVSSIAAADEAVGYTGSIYTGAQLAGLMNATAVAKATTVNLYADVTISGTWWKASDLFAGDNSTVTKVFAVTFNGNGHTIKTLKTTNTQATENTGIFSKFTENQNVTIKDLTLTSPNITTTNAANCGILVGSNAANLTVENVKITGATVSGANTVGGLVGDNTGTVTVKGATSVALSTDKGQWYVGGLIGKTSGNVTVGTAEVPVPVAVTTFALKSTTAVNAPQYDPEKNIIQAGTFGNLIGYINDADAEVNAYVTLTKGNTIEAKKANLKFENVTKSLYGIDFVFTGSTNNEIGFSPKVGTGKVKIGEVTFDANDEENGGQQPDKTINHFVQATSAE